MPIWESFGRGASDITDRGDFGRGLPGVERSPASELPFYAISGSSLTTLIDMGVVDRRLELFESIVRLRRAQRSSPASEDIASVRLALERELGETVSRRLAARLLGVSHTALERWIKAGDLPVVHTPAGSQAIPVSALLELYEAVRSEPADEPRRYVLAPAMLRQRQAAERMRFKDEGTGDRLGHDRAAARSLAYHRAVAGRLRKSMVSEARHVLYRWREQGRIDPRYASRWEHVLEMPIPEIRRQITATGAHADDLRQNSPFAGILSEPERRRLIAEVR